MSDHITYYNDIVQGTTEWLTLKLGVLSASTLKNVITAKTLKLSKAASNRLFYDEILSQRIDGTVQDSFMSYDMQRGHEDEPYAVAAYEGATGHKVDHCGFIVNDSLGFPLGFSPDGLVGDDGFIEIKSRVPKYQIKTILDHIAGRTDELMPSEFAMQPQCGFFVTGRKWCDFISFCNGLPMVIIRVFPNEEMQLAIHDAAIAFEQTLQENMEKYKAALAHDPRLIPTERREIETEMVI